VEEVMSSAIENLPGFAGTKTPPGNVQPTPVEERGPTTVPGQRETHEKKISQPNSTPLSRARLQGQAISYQEFIATVQEAGGLESAIEAEAASRATLSELSGCISWPQTQNLADWLPKPLRRLVNRRSFESSMSRFAPQAFLKGVAAQQRVGNSQASRHTRAVLLALEQTLPQFLLDQLHSELVSLWAPLTRLSASPQDHA
jgi:uncharacterized protein (DUF2267 family)